MPEKPQIIERKIHESADKIAAFMDPPFEIGVILGSGLGEFSQRVNNSKAMLYRQIPHFPVTSVSGHGDCLISGTLAGKRLLIMEGRFHYYEGHTIGQVVFPVRVMAQLGVKTLLITNSAGGVNTNFKRGQLMLLKDHINLMGTSPLRGGILPSWGPRFPDMTEVYDKELRDLAHRTAARLGIVLEEGVYAALAGPNYETPAEIRFLEMIGADAVGMSTVPEAIVARQHGIRVLGLSCISNLAAGKAEQPLCHEEVLETAAMTRKDFVRLLEGIICDI